MPYLTFADYQSYGGELVEPAFSRLEFKAAMLIDQHTFGRLKADTTFTEPVKRLTFELVGLLGNADTSAAGYQGAVTSESNDGYSISFAAGSVLTGESTEIAAKSLIEQYLISEKNQAGELLLCRWA